MAGIIRRRGIIAGRKDLAHGQPLFRSAVLSGAGKIFQSERADGESGLRLRGLAACQFIFDGRLQLLSSAVESVIVVQGSVFGGSSQGVTGKHGMGHIVMVRLYRQVVCITEGAIHQRSHVRIGYGGGVGGSAGGRIGNLQAVHIVPCVRRKHNPVTGRSAVVQDAAVPIVGQFHYRGLIRPGQRNDHRAAAFQIGVGLGYMNRNAHRDRGTAL